jgi:hypothetical protein
VKEMSSGVVSPTTAGVSGGMFPPLIWLAFVILVVAIVVIGGFVALRAGLWASGEEAGPTPDMRDRGNQAQEREHPEPR